MSSPRKSTDSRSGPEQHWSEDLARLHCLKALFPDWTGSDLFLLRQLKNSIEASIQQQPDLPDTFEIFSSMANSLRKDSPNPTPRSHAFVSIDYTGQTWDPLFARQQIVNALKKQAGMDHVFLLVRGLRKALFPAATYRTQAREAAYQEATRFIDQLARHWTTDSCRVHLLYL